MGDLAAAAPGRVMPENYYIGGTIPQEPKPGPVWPYGLAFDAALGAGAVLVTIRRLRTPARKLPRGIRVA